MASQEYEKIVKAVGSEAALARMLDTAQQHLNRMSKREEFTADWALRIRSVVRKFDPEMDVDVGALCSGLRGWTPPDAPQSSRKRGRPPGPSRESGLHSL
ncbi:hypothetical protein D3877_19920 [Azospirillum cavernae]|uniref:Uncharacterized protein n=1 Tax=Azospirillum cavernae TaxID=2320860 RepID=A0A418VYU0_9PROT|nr:hypothetical protein [Azospirillum cavernae]RJF82311.1 hypothetical protein D3877_19920 [Azospirillum cavernae]